MLNEMAFDNCRENPDFVGGKKVELLGSSQNSEVNQKTSKYFAIITSFIILFFLSVSPLQKYRLVLISSIVPQTEVQGSKVYRQAVIPSTSTTLSSKNTSSTIITLKLIIICILRIYLNIPFRTIPLFLQLGCKLYCKHNALFYNLYLIYTHICLPYFIVNYRWIVIRLYFDNTVPYDG